MRLVTIMLALAAVVATVILLMVDREDANAQTPAQGCASLTWDDWLPYIDGDHIDEYDPAVVTPVNYLKIDEARRLVWFAGTAHGHEGFTLCSPPELADAPTPTPTVTPTATATPVLIGCRWPAGFGHDFSAPISPIYERCLAKGGTLEYDD